MDERAATAERAVSETGGTDARDVPVRFAAVFLPAPLPRDGRIAFYDPEGGPVGDEPPGPPGDGPAPARRATGLTVVRPHGTGVRRRTTPAVALQIGRPSR
ncbi:hypothetical protein ACPF8X_25855, partial [Streptomyces sp. G35A]